VVVADIGSRRAAVPLVRLTEPASRLGNMSTTETVILVVVAAVVLLIIGNVVFSMLSERNNPPVGSFIDCDGVRLHYIDRGDPGAPCVVLFHGNGMMIQDFIICGLVELLARRHRVLCFDRPGFGHSKRPRARIWTATNQAELFVNALNQLAVRNPVVLGHSWGALVAVALGLRGDYPIRGLVLASGYYFPSWRWDVWIVSGPAIPVLGDLIRYTIGPIISWIILPATFRKLFAPRPVASNFKREFPSSLTLRPKQLRAAAEESALMIPTATQFRFLYPNIRCPVRIFHGTGDQIVECEQARHLHEVLPRSELKLVENTGHMVTYADQAAIADATAMLAGTIPALRIRAGGSQAGIVDSKTDAFGESDRTFAQSSAEKTS
jgi:pimeloyl-ACP methyl ester carboxylesterase